MDASSEDNTVQDGLQTLINMQYENNFRMQYGGVPEIVANRRETSVTALCEIIVKMKKMLAENGECEILLQDALGKNVELEKQNRDLQEEVVSLKSISETRLPRTGDEDVSGKWQDIANVRDEMARKIALLEKEKQELQEEVERLKSIGESRLNTENHRLLTNNPYDNLDSNYYNPTQFFHRVSTTNARKPRGKGSRAGGGRKKAETMDDSNKDTTTKSNGRGGGHGQGTKRKRGAEHEPAIEITYESYSSDEITAIQSNANMSEHMGSTSAVANPKSVSDESAGKCDESHDNNFFDYTSTFLDETNFSQM